MRLLAFQGPLAYWGKRLTCLLSAEVGTYWHSEGPLAYQVGSYWYSKGPLAYWECMEETSS